MIKSITDCFFERIKRKTKRLTTEISFKRSTHSVKDSPPLLPENNSNISLLESLKLLTIHRQRSKLSAKFNSIPQPIKNSTNTKHFPAIEKYLRLTRSKQSFPFKQTTMSEFT
jgi:hypothetical protein